ncbi:MAG: LemA family protein [Flavobacteriaceae bacterium]
MTGMILLVIVVVVALYGVVLYNRLVKLRQMVSEGWSGIDVQLKRRTDLIPNLLESVKGYMTHERGVLEEVTRLRGQAQAASNASPEERAKVEGALSMALGRLLAVVENYPDLKANQNFLDFQNALEETENEIQLSRRYYNGAVRNNNVAVESFPSNLIARQFGFASAEYFEIENAADREVPKVSFS